jgi:hypothetical protein
MNARRLEGETCQALNRQEKALALKPIGAARLVNQNSMVMKKPPPLFFSPFGVAFGPIL